MAFAAAPPGANYRNLLVLVELKGGNDGLNTLVPYADPAYYALRPKLAIARDQVCSSRSARACIRRSRRCCRSGRRRQLAVLQGVGYPARTCRISARSRSGTPHRAARRTFTEGWLTRAFAAAPVPRAFAADGVIIGGNDLGPLAGGGTRAIALSNTERSCAKRGSPPRPARRATRRYRHILKVEADIVQAAAHLDTPTSAFATEFPAGGFGNAVQHGLPDHRQSFRRRRRPPDACRDSTRTAVSRRRRRAFSASWRGGIARSKSRWTSSDGGTTTLVLTYAEFGRRPRENLSGGTDHGTANVHFALGGRVAGGFYGEAPALDRLPATATSVTRSIFARVYATVLERWWGVPSQPVLGGRFAAGAVPAGLTPRSRNPGRSASPETFALRAPDSPLGGPAGSCDRVGVPRGDELAANAAR